MRLGSHHQKRNNGQSLPRQRRFPSLGFHALLQAKSKSSGKEPESIEEHRATRPMFIAGPPERLGLHRLGSLSSEHDHHSECYLDHQPA